MRPQANASDLSLLFDQIINLYKSRHPVWARAGRRSTPQGLLRCRRTSCRQTTQTHHRHGSWFLDFDFFLLPPDDDASKAPADGVNAEDEAAASCLPVVPVSEQLASEWLQATRLTVVAGWRIKVHAARRRVILLVLGVVRFQVRALNQQHTRKVGRCWRGNFSSCRLRSKVRTGGERSGLWTASLFTSLKFWAWT